MSSNNIVSVERLPPMELKPVGIEIDYSDFADDARETWVTLYYDKQSGIGKFCSREKEHDTDHKDNREIAVVICHRKLVFSNAAIYDEGIDEKSGLREVSLHCDDLISVSDHFPEQNKEAKA